MLNRSGLLFLFSFVLSGCTLTTKEQHQETLSAIENVKTNLSRANTSIHKNLASQQLKISTLEKEIKRVATSVRTLKETKPPAPPLEPTIVYVEKEVLVHEEKGKRILGEVEWLWIDAIGQNYKARIDSGATTSSLNATDIQEFERDGKTWVRFHLINEEDVKTSAKATLLEKTERTIKTNLIEAPVIRWVKIRQASSEELDRRPVVELRIRLGPFHEKAQFTLANRSHMEFPVLLGREFFKDIAMVDVSLSYIYPQYIDKKQ